MQGANKKAVDQAISDELRAANKHFGVEKSELVELVNCYKSRKSDEDISAAHTLGGVEGLGQKLNVDLN